MIRFSKNGEKRNLWSALKLPKCKVVLKFWSLSQKEYFTNRSQRVKVYSSKTNKRFAETVSLHGAEVPGRPMREGARCAVIAKRHALANTKFCRHFVFSRNSDIPGSHLQSQYIKQMSFTLYVRLCRGEQNSSLYYIEETHYSERMIANMSKASALVDVSKKRVNPFK